MLIAVTIESASAAITTYTSRASFNAAVGSTTTQNFNSYLSDTSFRTAVVDVGDFSLSATGSPTTGYDLIDVNPDVGTDVDGTTNVRAATSNSPLTTVVFTFNSPITAFGADFRDLNNDAIRTQLLAAGDNVVPPIGGNIGLSFFGFTSSVPFSTVVFAPVTLDVYGIDNVSYANVPEPSTFLIATIGICAPALIVRRQLRRQR
jgi:hypothetical protein